MVPRLPRVKPILDLAYMEVFPYTLDEDETGEYLCVAIRAYDSPGQHGDDTGTKTFEALPKLLHP